MRRMRPIPRRTLLAAVAAGLVSPTRTATGVRCDTWPAAAGGQLTDALAAGGFDAPAVVVRSLTEFELDPAPRTPHVSVLRGWVRPPLTGDYTFAVSADDTALLYLSRDDCPAGRRLVASVPSPTGRREYHRYAAQASRPVRLLAGRRYYAEAWVCNAIGASHVSVAWTLPDGTTEAPIGVQRLTPAAGLVVPPTFDVGPVTAVRLAPDPLPAAAPGFHPRVSGAHVEMGARSLDLSYLLYLPGDFDRTSDARPLVVFLHGNSHQGTDLNGVLDEGPAFYLGHDPALRAAFPLAALFPQLPDDWRWDSPGAAGMVNAVVAAVCRAYPRLDRRRVYLTGLSMGGKGAWLAALDDPTLYAAVVPMSAIAVRPGLASTRLAGLPQVSIICGAEDDAFFVDGSRTMYAALAPAMDSRVRLTVVPHETHRVWARYYPDPQFYRELMTASR